MSGATATLVTLTQKSAVPENAGDGLLVGQAVTSLVGFYGSTPIVQVTNADQATVVDTGGGTKNAATGVTTITGTYNSTILANAFSTVIAQGNALRTALVNLGLIKGS